MSDNNPFETASEPNYLEILVGEGKKFKTVEDLAKGKKESDDYIETLKAELAAEKAKTANGINAEAILTEIRKIREGTSDTEPRQPGETTQVVTPPQIEELVLQTLRNNEIEQITKTNFQKSVEKMDEVWGDDAPKKLKETAKNLGVSVEYLQNVAKQSAPVFFQLTGLNADRSAPGGTTVPTSTVRPVAQNGQVRDMKYYRELKKSNPALFKEDKIRIQMEKDAIALGESFFN